MNKKNKTNLTVIDEKRNELCEILATIENLHKEAKLVKKALAADFIEHEQEYRDGIRTPSGLLVRKPKWEFEVKPILKIED